jgi:hypothetical protein
MHSFVRAVPEGGLWIQELIRVFLDPFPVAPCIAETPNPAVYQADARFCPPKRIKQ